MTWDPAARKLGPFCAFHVRALNELAKFHGPYARPGMHVLAPSVYTHSIVGGGRQTLQLR